MVASNSRYVAERSGKEDEREGADRKGGGKGKARGQGKINEGKGEERRGQGEKEGRGKGGRMGNEEKKKKRFWGHFVPTA